LRTTYQLCIYTSKYQVWSYSMIANVWPFFAVETNGCADFVDCQEQCIWSSGFVQFGIPNSHSLNTNKKQSSQNRVSSKIQIYYNPAYSSAYSKSSNP